MSSGRPWGGRHKRWADRSERPTPATLARAARRVDRELDREARDGLVARRSDPPPSPRYPPPHE